MGEILETAASPGEAIALLTEAYPEVPEFLIAKHLSDVERHVRETADELDVEITADDRKTIQIFAADHTADYLGRVDDPAQYMHRRATEWTKTDTGFVLGSYVGASMERTDDSAEPRSASSGGAEHTPDGFPIFSEDDGLHDLVKARLEEKYRAQYDA